MTLTQQIAKHLRDVYFGGNWTDSNLKDQLADVTWKQATTQIYSLNTIAILVNHLNYYVREVAKVLRGAPLTASDKFSFDHPPINSQEDWDTFLNQVWKDCEAFANLIEQVPENRLLDDFSEDKYGNYFRNLQGIIEHAHYHLGQIAIIKKIVLQQN